MNEQQNENKAACGGSALTAELGLPEKLRAYVNSNGDWAAGLLPSDVLMAAIEIERLRAAYNELIYAVCRKHPGETRHETALRYIRRMEEPSECAASVVPNA